MLYDGQPINEIFQKAGILVLYKLLYINVHTHMSV